MSSNVHEAVLVERREIARAIDELTFAMDSGTLAFRPGQFVSLRVGQDQDGAAILRSYSIASAPGKARIALVVKRVPGGAAHSYLDALAPGARVRFTGPMGFFVLELSHPGDVVFGVTGVGIAPVLPMLDELLARDERGRVQLFWGNRLRAELFWQRELDALSGTHPRFSWRSFLSGEAPGDGEEEGRITTPLLSFASSLERPTFYLVGSGAMIKDVKTALVALGIDRKRQIRNEAFFD